MHFTRLQVQISMSVGHATHLQKPVFIRWGQDYTEIILTKSKFI